MPTALSAAVLLVLASYTSYWDIRTPLGLGVFGFLLVALSLFLSLRVDAFTLARRRRDGKRRLLNRAGSTSRLVKFILGGLAIPIGALIAANMRVLPNHQTPMTMASLAVRTRLAGPELARAAMLGDAVLRAGSPAAKVQGILALQAMSSAEALDQLFRILGDDNALKSSSELEALSTALASYGAQARMRLLQRFNSVPPSARRAAPGPTGDLLAREIDGSSPGSSVPANDAERVALVPSFIMQTLLRMRLKDNADLLAFARQTAADEGWSAAVRGQALQLTAKLGGKEDLDGLFAYLDSPSALLQAEAMRAIAALQSKLSEAGSSATEPRSAGGGP